MFYKTTSDTSFKGHFKSNVECGIRSYKLEASLLLKIMLTLGFIVAPFFWAWYAFRRSKAKLHVMVVVKDPNPN